MIVHIVNDVKCCVIVEQLTDVGVFLPHNLLEGGRDLLIVTLLRLEDVLNVRLFASEGGQTRLEGPICSLLGALILYVEGDLHVHLNLLRTLHALASSRLGKDPSSCECVEGKVKQWDNLAQDLSSGRLIYDLKLQEVMTWPILELSHEINGMRHLIFIPFKPTTADLSTLHEDSILNLSILDPHTVLLRDVLVGHLEVVNVAHDFAEG